MGINFWEVLKNLDKIARWFSRHLEGIGIAGLWLMFLVNFIDVVGAKLFLWPVPGATEIISFSQIVAIAPAIAYTLMLNRHIRVEFITMRFPKRLRGLVHCVVALFSLLIFLLILWQSFEYGRSLQKAGEVGSTSGIPFYPFAYFLAFCSLPVCLALFVEILQSLSEVFNHGSR